MGRLLKRQVDKIKQMRDQGYTQTETAEAVGCSIRTVRKYWYANATEESTRVEGRLKAIEEGLKAVGELLILLTILFDEEALWCQRCERFSLVIGGGWTWKCSECGHTVGPIPFD